MHDDLMRLREIDDKNKALLKTINRINKMGGKVDTFNPVAYQNFSKWETHEKKMKTIYYHNLEIYNSIKQAVMLFLN